MSRKAPTVKALIMVYLVLLVLLGATVGVAYLPLGSWGPVGAMGIAGAKAILVALIFMQLRYRSNLVAIFAAGGLVWLGILFLLTFADYWTRGG